MVIENAEFSQEEKTQYLSNLCYGYSALALSLYKIDNKITKEIEDIIRIGELLLSLPDIKVIEKNKKEYLFFLYYYHKACFYSNKAEIFQEDTVQLLKHLYRC